MLQLLSVLLCGADCKPTFSHMLPAAPCCHCFWHADGQNLFEDWLAHQVCCCVLARMDICVLGMHRGLSSAGAARPHITRSQLNQGMFTVNMGCSCFPCLLACCSLLLLAAAHW